MELSPGRPEVAGGQNVSPLLIHVPGSLPVAPPHTNLRQRTSKAEDCNDGLAGAKRQSLTVWIVAAAIIATFFKLTIAYNTFGTNDAITYYGFARSLSDHGLEWTYGHVIPGLSTSSAFNHPPLTAYFLRGIYHLSRNEWFRSNGLTFPFLLRLPGIVADVGVIFLLLRIAAADDQRLHLASSALVLFAVSPVSLMVTGFHGNTDPVMVCFLLAGCYMATRKRAALCGLFFALSCQVKIVPLLLLPVFVCFWLNRRALLSFVVGFASVSLVLWSEPLLNFPSLFVRNVLSYGSYWGIWGITYWLRLTQLSGFNYVWFEGLPVAERIVVACLKAIIIGSVVVIGWRRRMLPPSALMQSVAYTWLVFFIFSPGVCAQYLVWPAPFILLLSSSLYVWLTISSSLFLFSFYNITAHGLPWYKAISTGALNSLWTPWTVWPWAVLIAGAIVLWRKARLADSNLRLVSLRTLPGATRSSLAEVMHPYVPLAST